MTRAKGGQGVVYLARWPGSPDGPVALKTPHGARDAGAAADLSEITLIRQVARFCTARVLDAGTDRGRPYIVSEYVDGPSLRDAVEDGGPLSGVELERLAVGTMVALAATHAADVVHRDFTPGNVLLAPDGPRVVDFGVARALGPSGRGAPGASGTPAFMAPEQAAGGEVGAAADVFAWAVTMTFAALGPGPFAGGPPRSAFGRLLDLERRVADLPTWLAEIVGPCLREDPADRPTAPDVLVRLLGYRDDRRPEEHATRHDRRSEPGRAAPPAPEVGHPARPPSAAGTAPTPAGRLPGPRRDPP
ncbi:serine/threonine-protein kinase [Actinomadura sp. 1N219]|uniref:serine/threonine-protein kinase n=1 Tax=Actinomadura sp. 1N219 TaxID=3375152 RepID=UPI0037B93EBF